MGFIKASRAATVVVSVISFTLVFSGRPERFWTVNGSPLCGWCWTDVLDAPHVPTPALQGLSAAEPPRSSPPC